MQPPEFWSSNNGVARLLAPFGALVNMITARRIANTTPFRAAAPVLCVGALTVGGAGKTPVAISIANRLKDFGRNPAILTRGYGGKLAGPVRVDRFEHTIEDVGDEALLHAAAAPTWVARKRALAAEAAVKDGADVLVMDDGHQHASLAKDMSLVVMDGRYGFGNGRVMPAGPLREDLENGLARADAVVIMGDDPHDFARRLAPRLPVLKARLAPGPEQNLLRGQRVVAFAGIGDPGKFFRTLQDVGAQVIAKHPFDDHYVFEPADIQPILDEAFALRAIPVTTAKDAVRLSPDQRQQVNVLPVTVAWDDPDALDRLLQAVLAKP